MIAFILSSKFSQLFNFQCLILGFLDFYFYRVLHLNLCIWRQLITPAPVTSIRALQRKTYCLTL